MDFAKAVDQVISEHLPELTKPGVISIRPGYQSAGHWLTKKPAIVVTVERKRDDVPTGDRLPETLGGYPVDVREADAVQKLRMTNQALFTAVAAGARPEMWRPVFPYERFIAGPNMAATEEAIAAFRRPQKPQVEYSGPADASLDVVEDDVTIICHASPDAGWPTLKPFFEQTKARMTVGMYDFTSGHILDTVKSALKDDKVSLVLDHPAPNKTRDQTDEDTVTALRTEFGGRFEFAWALERMDGMASAWIYPNAYHIKVAVRDGTAFWLSSGNWNNSNQPDIDPLSDPAGSATVARKSDRDWHVIVFHKGLASTYEKYLLNDLRVAEQHQKRWSWAAPFAVMTSGFHVIAAVATDLVREELQPRLERVVVAGE